MALNLITGYAGIPHITSENDGAVNAALYGSERYVLNTGQKFAYEIISNNLIRIKDGYAMNQGRKIGLAISEYEDLTIDNGLQGVKRSDIIVIRYTKNLDTGIESADFVVVKGTSGDAYKDPALETGNIIQGDSVDDLPLYRVKIDGLSIAAVEPMFNVLMSMQEMQDEIASNASAIAKLNSNLFNILPEKQLHASGDLNDLTQGFYRCIETPHNVPPVSLTGGFANDYGRVVVFGYTDYRIQIFFNSWGNYIAWRRCSTSSGWSDWMLV